jgi:hypothetical protein
MAPAAVIGGVGVFDPKAGVGAGHGAVRAGACCWLAAQVRSRPPSADLRGREEHSRKHSASCSRRGSARWLEGWLPPCLSGTGPHRPLLRPLPCTTWGRRTQAGINGKYNEKDLDSGRHKTVGFLAAWGKVWSKGGLGYSAAPLAGASCCWHHKGPPAALLLLQLNGALVDLPPPNQPVQRRGQEQGRGQ